MTTAFKNHEQFGMEQAGTPEFRSEDFFLLHERLPTAKDNYRSTSVPCAALGSMIVSTQPDDSNRDPHDPMGLIRATNPFLPRHQ